MLHRFTNGPRRVISVNVTYLGSNVKEAASLVKVLVCRCRGPTMHSKNGLEESVVGSRGKRGPWTPWNRWWPG